MKTNELRIGNYVKFSDPINGTNIYRVYYIADYSNINSVSLEGKGQLASCAVKDIEPIKLTEKVLFIVGFEKFAKHFIMILNGYRIDYEIDKTLRIYKIHTDCCLVKDLEIKCEYLHQLQNAYNLLTNEELKVEL